MPGASVDDLRGVFADAGARGWLHAIRIGADPDGPSAEVSLDAEAPVPMASVYKLPLAVAWADLADRGKTDPRAVLDLGPHRRTPGPTGVSILQDGLQISARDLVRLMLTLSDNAAADSILELVGLERLNATVRGLGLTDTYVRHGTHSSQQRVQLDTGTRTFEASLLALAALHREVQTAEYDPAVASSTSARDMTRLLALLWTREVAGGESGELVRQSMTQQVWRNRLAAGFPHDDVTVAGKTGTLGVLRHEVGVVTFPGEHPVAVAVFTRSVRAETRLPRVDQAIGEAARRAVHQLRRPLVGQSEAGR